MESSVKYVVSACLAGELCRYDGLLAHHPAVQELVRQGIALPVCPEVLGGLPVPRTPCERRGESVYAADGRDCTAEFQAGAEAALRLAQKHGCRAAILKSRSPSCGAGQIYDGTFSHCRIAGDGVFAALLRREGFALFTEENLPDELVADPDNRVMDGKKADEPGKSVEPMGAGVSEEPEELKVPEASE